MADFRPLTTVTEMLPGTMKTASLERHEYLVARVGDEYLVTDSRCPHMGGHLVKGLLEGTVVTCPFHKSQFDLRGGSVLRWTDWQGAALKIATKVKSPRNLKTYAVRMEGETLLVGPEIRAS